ncbi:crotonase/enoyl-CoA hydratase family protein [Elongatibacter sediminis]|uniref:Crotonase/enoyl-CoA hydratase family protein n=1 Tax=Elongatibacter sediminis TaxID=3119006 RepID=A0AAW9RG96_9GAMM
MVVRIERDGPVMTILINRPEVRNAVDADCAAALVTAFQAFETDENSQVAVLAGTGGSFCSGADLKAIAEGAPNRIDDRGHGPMGPTRMKLSKPVIAAIEGHAVAGGLELALWCDLRVAASDAVFGVYCRRWGVPLIDGGTVRLPRLIGQSHALDLVLTGRGVSGEEARMMGLANRIVPPGRALIEAQLLAADLAELPQQCLRSDRLGVLEQWGFDEAEAMRREFARGREVLESGESREGARAFSEGAGRHGARRRDT